MNNENYINPAFKEFTTQIYSLYNTNEQNTYTDMTKYWYTVCIKPVLRYVHMST